MRTDLNYLKRRPFLLPLLMPVGALVIIAVVAVWMFDARVTTVVVVVPHAEVEQTSELDANLSLAGKERAMRLARMLAALQTPRAIDVILAADSRRAQQTVHPLAETLSLAVNVVTQAGWETLAARISDHHRGQVVLVAGDVRQIAHLLTDLSGEDVTIADGVHDQLYIAFLPRLSHRRVLRLGY